VRAAQSNKAGMATAYAIIFATLWLLITKPLIGGIVLGLLLVRMCWWGARQPKAPAAVVPTAGSRRDAQEIDEDDVWFDAHKTDRRDNKRYNRETMGDLRRRTA
jgi:hypothetical protein